MLGNHGKYPAHCHCDHPKAHASADQSGLRIPSGHTATHEMDFALDSQLLKTETQAGSQGSTNLQSTIHT